MPPPTPQTSVHTAVLRGLQLLLLGLLALVAGCQSRGGADVDSTAAAKPTEWRRDTQPQLPQHEDIWERIRAGYQLQDQIGTNPRVERQRFGFASRPTSIQRIAERSSPYIHYIVERLEANDMPLELALLPMIESSYNPMAYSPAHAAGLWQFIPSTGRHFNLRQTDWYDGRRDITASTNAAISYLKRLHDMFNGDWLLALAAYNAGEGTVSRAIERNQRNGLPTDYWNLPLPQETRDYVPKLLAVSQIIQTPASYGVTLAPIANEPYFEKVAIRQQLDLARVASMANVDKGELFQLNPAFKQGITLDGPLHLLVPVDKADGLSESLARLPPEQVVRWQQYRVRRGDNLQGVASRHGIGSETLREVNRLGDNHLRVGQTLLIPSRDDTPRPVMQRERRQALPTQQRTVSNTPRSYRVRNGDTLWGIAQRHNVKIDDLQRWNRLKGKSLSAGQVLKLGSVQASNQGKRSAVTYYKVRRGDSLSAIAQRFDVGAHHLKKWNPSLGRTLKPGQTLTLYLPGR